MNSTVPNRDEIVTYHVLLRRFLSNCSTRPLFQRTDYGQVIKVYGTTGDDQRHFSPGNIIGMRKKRVFGNISHHEICTSHCERLNGTIRNYVKRMCRLTYAFSKKWENHHAALVLFFMAYNYVKPHKSLKKKTPAMAHGIADHVWTVRELLIATSD